MLLALGRFDEAEREINRARQLDPGSLIISREYASVAFFRRDFSLALQRCRYAAEMDPMFAPTHKILGDIYLSLKRYDEAIAEFRKLIELEGHAPRYAGALGYTYGLVGRRHEAREELRTLTELSAQGEYVPAAAFGMIHTGLGNFDLAFEWFDKACDERDNDLPFFKFAPSLDPLRSDRMSIKPFEDTSTGKIHRIYVYTIDGKEYPFDNEEIVHISLYNPLNDLFGLPPLRASGRRVDTSNAI